VNTKIAKSRSADLREGPAAPALSEGRLLAQDFY
jgi:hypothetical protein